MPINMNLKDMEFFRIVAEEENLRRAATRLNISQPALSRRIRSLEESLGFELFHRNAQRIRLSHAGRTFLRFSRDFLTRYEMGAAQARDVAHGSTGQLVIGMSDFAIRNPSVSAALRMLRKQVPDVRLSVRMVSRTPFVEQLKSGSIDLAFLTDLVSTEPDTPNSLIEQIDLHAAIPKNHRCANLAKIKAIDLDGEDILWFEPGLAPRITHHVEGRFAELGSHPEFQYLTVSENTRMHLTATGLGISLLSANFVNYLPNRVVIRPIVDLGVSIALRAAWANDNINPAFAKLLPTIENMWQRARRS